MGSITDKISKEEFDIAYDNHLPSKWIIFAYKHFSTSAERKRFGLRNWVVEIAGALFVAGLLATIFNLPKNIIGIFLIPYSILVGGLVLFLFNAVFANNYRIKLIRKELDITKAEYDALVSVYY